jgi:dihydroorotase
LLIRGAHVIDPAQDRSDRLDIATSGGKIARVAPGISESDARHVLNYQGMIATPGWIDLHVHVYDGATPLGVPPDPSCIAKGVTTVLDAGSAGAHNFPGFRQYVINTSQTRVRALLNISIVGIVPLSREGVHGELPVLEYADTDMALRTIERHRDVILGIKVRVAKGVSGKHDLKAVQAARDVAEAAKVPIMLHVGVTYTPLKDLLAVLRPGDVLTHCFRGGPGWILDDQGRVLPEVRDTLKRGIFFDVGHGSGSFSFDVAERALQQDVIPRSISSDLHQMNMYGPVFDMETTVAKFLALGMPLEQVIARVTAYPATMFGFPAGLGTLREGVEADIAVFALREREITLRDPVGQRRTAHRTLSPVATIKGGKLYGTASLPVPGSD